MGIGLNRFDGIRFEQSKILLILIIFLISFPLAHIMAQTTYYSQSTGNFSAIDPPETSIWNSASDGSGSPPANLQNGDNFVIQNPHTVTLDGSSFIIRSLTIESGGAFDNSTHSIQIIYLGSGGLFSVESTGSYVPSTGELYFSSFGSAPFIIQSLSNLAFNKIGIQGGSLTMQRISGTSTYDYTLNDSLKFNSGAGTLTLSAINLIYGNGSSLVYATGSNYTIGSEWTDAIGPDNVVINNSASVTSTLGFGNELQSLTGDLSLLTGILDYNSGNHTLTVSGDVIGGNGYFGTTNNNRLIVDGAGSEVTSLASDKATIYNLTMESTSGFLSEVDIVNNLLITGSVQLQSSFTLVNSTSTITVDGTLDLNGFSINKLTGSPTITISSGGTLQTGGTSLGGFTWVFSSNSEVVFDGTSQESINSNYAFDDVNISNSAGVSVGTSSPTADTLFLNQGNLITTGGLITVNRIAGGGSTNHVVGPLQVNNAAGEAITFPLGKSRYRPVQINLSGSTPSIRFEVFDATPNQSFNSPLQGISVVRYWRGQVISGSISAGTVTLNYGSDDGVTNTNELGDLVVARSSNNSSNPYASLGSAGLVSVDSGSVTSANPIGTSLGYFTLGTETGDNSLPVQLSAFSADLDFNRVTLKWITSSELQNEGFNLYKRSAPGDDWNRVNPQLIAGQGNTSSETSYEFVDQSVAAGQKYEYLLESISYAGVRVAEQTLEVTVPVPAEFSLEGNYPNPFNPSTRIRFQLPEQSAVSVFIYDIRGNLVNKLAYNQAFDAGAHELTWNAVDDAGRPVSSGMYVYRFAAGSFQKTGKMIFLK